MRKLLNTCTVPPVHRHRRRAASYMLVIGTATLLTVIGFAALVQARITTRVISDGNAWSEAGVLASATADAIPLVMNARASWRTQFTSGVRQTGTAIGRGTTSFVLVDEGDGNLADNNMDPVRAYGIGGVGGATRVRSVLLRPTGRPGLTCLDVAIHAGQLLYFQDLTLYADRPVTANTGAYASSGTNVYADVEARSWILGGVFHDARTTGVASRELPHATDVFEYYITNGTVIPLNLLEDRSTFRVIDNTVLSPNHNPYTGETNPLGIYIVDCQEQPVYVSDSRIVGTLVLLNAPTGNYATRCTVRRYVFWEPAVSNFPALLVDGTVALEFYGDANLEEAAHDVNYNPPGVPYLGQVDATKDDVYPSRINGMIYANTDVYLTGGTPRISGLIVAGQYVLRNSSSGGCTVTVRYDETYSEHPPPGFSRGPLAAEPGSWKWDKVP